MCANSVESYKWSIHLRWIFAFVFFAILFTFAGHRTWGGDAVEKDRKPRVLLFSGSDKDDPFWILFTDFMSVAADQLGFELKVHFADGSLNAMASLMRVECERKVKPAGIVIQSFKRGGPRFLRIANSYRIPVFLVNSGLTAEQSAITGEPRTHLEHWIAEMLPDDYGAGFQLANALIDEARKDPAKISADGRVHIIGLSGTVSHGASVQRAAGLMDAIAAREDEAILDQMVSADWKRGYAKNRCRILHRRYPEASIVWAASDQMALGAAQAIRDRGFVPGKDVVIGGVDATREGLKAIEKGTLAATVGGHFQEGGWVAVILHDLVHGLDLEKIPTHFVSPMTLVTAENMATYRAGLRAKQWKQIDFLQFSRLHQPESDNYRFRFDLGENSAETSMPSIKESPPVEKPARNE
ncbi:ABC transporter substrate-binding protein [Aporhodopirellula aestuarii]|uniref:ABC transporter substrate-binding protein n=1 Tax=Aporhodopirellula aestuarii TaxID=2950107 RepID=A0ABT0U857_9BACT|nr:ABC transporter substrate-binding protein [Aporhodopirellula aestuarii]MCM2373109.1 ABC transporter substrate-binding protein [Aporhodopirellula aestuarii]